MIYFIGNLAGGLGGWLAGIGAVIAAIAGVWLTGRRSGAQTAKRKAKEADYERASEIRENADDALRRLDGDSRDVDDKLHEIGGFRD